MRKPLADSKNALTDRNPKEIIALSIKILTYYSKWL
jgi:hypothetical protein